MSREPESATPTPITPLSIDLSRSATSGNRKSPGDRIGLLAWFGLGLLILVALAVIFVLPKLVPAPVVDVRPPPAGTTTPTRTAASVPVPVKAPPTPEESAEHAELRNAAQDLLAEIRDIEKVLVDQGVELWAKNEFDAAGKRIAEGADAYNFRNFAKARTAYGEALDGLRALAARAEAEYAAALARGIQFLNEGKSADAKRALALALRIKPDDAAALKGAGRAESLDQVMAFVGQGDNALNQGMFAEARDHYQKALELDPETERARAGLKSASDTISQQQFASSMSRGYAALDRNDLGVAQTAFAEAGRLRPGSPEARSAEAEVAQRLTTARIKEALQAAREFETAEKWTEALARYDAALKLDPNLAPALSGKQNAAHRLDVDQRLRAAIARPERLSDPAVHAGTRGLLNEAGTISAPGPDLKKQIAVTSALLEQSRIPMRVSLQSDNATEVNLYRVGMQGKFAQKEIDLIPGSYIAVGTRPGFRDVRVEFTVNPGQAAPVVNVSCVEPIVSGR